MPDFDQIPKSHTVTFNYYVGLIHFLEENYKEVQLSLKSNIQAQANIIIGRRKSYASMAYVQSRFLEE
jgi:hypothetical protein